MPGIKKLDWPLADPKGRPIEDVRDNSRYDRPARRRPGNRTQLVLVKTFVINATMRVYLSGCPLYGHFGEQFLILLLRRFRQLRVIEAFSCYCPSVIA